jgi:hypothetical protein
MEAAASSETSVFEPIMPNYMTSDPKRGDVRKKSLAVLWRTAAPSFGNAVIGNIAFRPLIAYDGGELYLLPNKF